MFQLEEDVCHVDAASLDTGTHVDTVGPDKDSPIKQASMYETEWETR